MTVHNNTSENIQRLPDGSRRRFLKTSSTFGLALMFNASTRDAFAEAKYGMNQEEEPVTKSSVTQRTSEQPAYGIEDSPIGLAAWMLDHDAASLALITRVFNGQSEGLTRDDILDNITLYWLTNTAISSARLYWENRLTARSGRVRIPNSSITRSSIRAGTSLRGNNRKSS